MNIGQGTAGAALVSSLNIDLSLKHQFAESQGKVFYGNVELQPLLFQDDVAIPSNNILSEQAGNDNVIK